MIPEFFDAILCNLITRGGAVPILRKNCHPFPPFPFTNTALPNEDFYIIQLPLFITTPLPAFPLPFSESHLPLEK